MVIPQLRSFDREGAEMVRSAASAIRRAPVSISLMRGLDERVRLGMFKMQRVMSAGRNVKARSMAPPFVVLTV